MIKTAFPLASLGLRVSLCIGGLFFILESDTSHVRNPDLNHRTSTKHGTKNKNLLCLSSHGCDSKYLLSIETFLFMLHHVFCQSQSSAITAQCSESTDGWFPVAHKLVGLSHLQQRHNSDVCDSHTYVWFPFSGVSVLRVKLAVEGLFSHHLLMWQIMWWGRLSGWLKNSLTLRAGSHLPSQLLQCWCRWMHVLLK